MKISNEKKIKNYLNKDLFIFIIITQITLIFQKIFLIYTHNQLLIQTSNNQYEYSKYKLALKGFLTTYSSHFHIWDIYFTPIYLYLIILLLNILNTNLTIKIKQFLFKEVNSISTIGGYFLFFLCIAISSFFVVLGQCGTLMGLGLFFKQNDLIKCKSNYTCQYLINNDLDKNKDAYAEILGINTFTTEINSLPNSYFDKKYSLIENKKESEIFFSRKTLTDINVSYKYLTGKDEKLNIPKNSLIIYQFNEGEDNSFFNNCYLTLKYIKKPNSINIDLTNFLIKIEQNNNFKYFSSLSKENKESYNNGLLSRFLTEDECKKLSQIQ